MPDILDAFLQKEWNSSLDKLLNIVDSLAKIIEVLMVSEFASKKTNN